MLKKEKMTKNRIAPKKFLKCVFLKWKRTRYFPIFDFTSIVSPLPFMMIFLLLNCCISKSSKMQEQDDVIPEPPYIIYLEKEIDNVKLSKLTEIANAITYIPLETNKESLLKPLRKVLFTESNIAAYDFYNIIMFDVYGLFFKQIGRHGQGPGEYNSITLSDYCFSQDGTKIYVLTGNSVCFEFNLEGNFLNTYKLDSMPSKMLPLNDSLFVFYCTNRANYSRPSPTKQSLIISDLNNQIKKAYQNHFLANNKQMVSNPGAPFYTYKDNIRFKEFGVDTLYTVTVDDLITYAIITLGKKEIPPDLIMDPSEFLKLADNGFEGKFFLRWILEDDYNLFLTLYNWKNDLYGYYNKHNNSVKIIGVEGFQNDIDGGLPFFPKYIYKDSILVDYVNSFTLREHVLKGNATEMRRLFGQKYDDLVKLVNSIDDESNPIVVIVNR